MFNLIRAFHLKFISWPCLWSKLPAWSVLSVLIISSLVNCNIEARMACAYFSCCQQTELWNNAKDAESTQDTNMSSWIEIDPFDIFWGFCTWWMILGRSILQKSMGRHCTWYRCILNPPFSFWESFIQNNKWDCFLFLFPFFKLSLVPPLNQLVMYLHDALGLLFWSWCIIEYRISSGAHIR